MFRSSVFRNILSKLVLTAGVVVLAGIVAPLVSGAARYVLIAAAVLFAAAVTVLSVLLERKALLLPLRGITAAAGKLSKGERDITSGVLGYDADIKALSENFNSVVGQFDELELMRREFVSNAGHELKSPLTSIQGFIQAILDGTIAYADQKKYLEIALNEAKRLSAMIQSMLDLSRMESGKNPVKLEKFELNEAIKQIVLKFEPNFFTKSITIDVDFVKPQVYVVADKIKIQQVLTNLIDNAIKYSPNHSKIRLSTLINQRKIYVSVKDQGVGISKKDQIHIWDRFYMADRSRTPGAGKGTGLGLSIVKTIIDEHKEAIWVESNKDDGSNFIFTLTLFDPTRHG